MIRRVIGVQPRGCLCAWGETHVRTRAREKEGRGRWIYFGLQKKKRGGAAAVSPWPTEL